MPELSLRIPKADDVIINVTDLDGEVVEAPFPEMVEAWKNRDNTGGGDPDRIAQLEAQVADLTEQVGNLTEDLQTKTAELDAANVTIATLTAAVETAQRDAANAATARDEALKQYNDLLSALVALIPE